jgi:hypothetical protein
MGGFTAWTFRSFISGGDRCVVQAWYDDQEPEVKAEFDTALERLRVLPPERWDWPYVGKLRKECSGLIEIRFKVNNVQHRPLGCTGPLRLEFTILFFATERGNKIHPRSACATALRRKTLVLGHREYSREWNF